MEESGRKVEDDEGCAEYGNANDIPGRPKTCRQHYQHTQHSHTGQRAQPVGECVGQLFVVSIHEAFTPWFIAYVHTVAELAQQRLTQVCRIVTWRAARRHGAPFPLCRQLRFVLRGTMTLSG